MKTNDKNIDRGGFSLITSLVTITVVGAGAAWVTQVTSDGMRGNANLGTKLERDAILRQLVRKVDCTRSFPEGTCSTGGAKMLLDKDGHVLVSATTAVTKFGRHTVKAECNATNDGLVVKSALLMPSGTLASTADIDFVPDELNNKVKTWSHPSALLSDKTICPSFGTESQSSDIILFENRNPWGKDGGNCSPANNWNKVKFDTKVADVSNSLTLHSGNKSFELTSGTYECVFYVPIRMTDASRTRLYDEDNNRTIAYSQSMRLSIASPSPAIRTKFTVTGKTQFSLQVRCIAPGTPDALGVGTETKDEDGNKIYETFAQAQCRKFSE